MTIQQIPAAVTASTRDLLSLADISITDKFDRPFDQSLLPRLKNGESVRHALALRAVLDQRGGEKVEPFVRCVALVAVKDQDEPAELSHFDVRLRDYIALDHAKQDPSDNTMDREIPSEYLQPDDRTPR